jgi:hypothetical protein
MSCFNVSLKYKNYKTNINKIKEWIQLIVKSKVNNQLIKRMEVY